MSQYGQIVCDLLQARRAEPSATNIFKQWKHDAHLCPKFQQKLEAIFSAFEKYNVVSYEIQGLKDEGTDVLLQERVDDQKESVCFQIKGEWDLNQKDYLKTLKAQYFDSRKRYEPDLKDYYIVVCYSIVSEGKAKSQLVIDETRREKVKAIIREFAGESKVRVVEPEYAAWFLGLSSIQIDVIIKSRFGNEDIVFKEAINLVSELSSTEKTILVFMLWLHLYGGRSFTTAQEIIRSEFIQRTFVSLPDETGDDDEDYSYYGLDLDSQVAGDLDRLEGNFIERREGSDFFLPLESVQPLAVLLMDGHIRYEYGGDELMTYMLGLLGVVSSESIE